VTPSGRSSLAEIWATERMSRHKAAMARCSTVSFGVRSPMEVVETSASISRSVWVGLDRCLDRQGGAEGAADLAGALAGEGGVGPGQVDVLEHARARGGRGEAARSQPMLVDGDDLTRLNLADQGGADDVQRGGLGGDDPAARQPADAQRPHAVWVAHARRRSVRP
jgi:hypothetical protein